MKKSIFTIIGLALCSLTIPVFAAEPVFSRHYVNKGRGLYGQRLYDVSEYLNGTYRSNFVNIPQNRMLNYYEGFENKVGVFELEGTTLYLGWFNEGNGYKRLRLIDENKNNYIDYKNQEVSFFSYSESTGVGLVTEINLKGKKYTIAVAGRNSDYDGFRMWVENEAAKDSAWSKKGDLHYTQNGKDMTESVLCYDWDDVFEGVYKAGWKRLWGTVSGESEIENYKLKNYKYTYKDTDFICAWDNDYTKGLLNPDGTEIPYKNFQYFSLWGIDENGNKMPGWCSGIEGDVQIGKNKIRIAVLSGDEKKRVFVKDTSGYPVIKTVKANQSSSKTKSQKVEKNKKSGKSAAFTRDYDNWKRVYSKNDISKGLYKSNYKLIAQNGSEEYTLTRTYNDGTEKKAHVKAALYNYKDYSFTVSYDPLLGWNLFSKQNEAGLKLNRTNIFTIEDLDYSGLEAELILNGETVVENLAIVPLDIEKGDYRLFIKTGSDEELATNYTDASGIEYYDAVDVYSGIYKPGFEYLDNYYYLSNDEAISLYPDLEGIKNDRVYDFIYKGFRFFVGPDHDPRNYVKDSDGNVIFNPETQIRYITYDNDNNPNYKPWLTYGWEGKVKLGDRDVILAVFKWNHVVSVFIKEL